MAESSKQTIRQPWQPPIPETVEERNRREQREQQARFFVDCVKQAIREVAEESKENDGEDFFSSLFK